MGDRKQPTPPPKDQVKPQPPPAPPRPVLPARIGKLQITVEPWSLSGKPGEAAFARVSVRVNGREEYHTQEYFHDSDDFTSRFEIWLPYAADNIKRLIKEASERGKPDASQAELQGRGPGSKTD